MYDVIIKKPVIKQLHKIFLPGYSKIKKALSGLALLVSTRVIYEIVDDKLIIVITIAHRKEVYE